MRSDHGDGPNDDKETATLPKFLIEREIPGAGKLSADELQAIAARSNSVLADMAPRAQWLQSYVTADKIYCVYVAANEEAVREHARCSGFPANTISKVTAVIDPTTSESVQSLPVEVPS
jgi:hypothetical protein